MSLRAVLHRCADLIADELEREDEERPVSAPKVKPRKVRRQAPLRSSGAAIDDMTRARATATLRRLGLA